MVGPLAAGPRGHSARVFRMGGCGHLPGAELGLPLLPLRLSAGRSDSGRLVNAILDSASSRTMLPFEMAEVLEAGEISFDDRVQTAGGEAEVGRATVDLHIVDSHLPAVVHWNFDRIQVQVAGPDAGLDLPIVGWDILARFDTCLYPRQGLIVMRPIAHASDEMGAVRLARGFPSEGELPVP